MEQQRLLCLWYHLRREQPGHRRTASELATRGFFHHGTGIGIDTGLGMRGSQLIEGHVHASSVTFQGINLLGTTSNITNDDGGV